RPPSPAASTTNSPASSCTPSTPPSPAKATPHPTSAPSAAAAGRDSDLARQTVAGPSPINPTRTRPNLGREDWESLRSYTRSCVTNVALLYSVSGLPPQVGAGKGGVAGRATLGTHPIR